MHIKRTHMIYAVCAVLAGMGALAWNAARVQATTNVRPEIDNHWAWNDVIEWIDFYHYPTENVILTSYKLTGYASSSIGNIYFDCAMTGDCAEKGNYKVTNDGEGNLSGWAWNDAVGWISFDCHNNGGSCGTLYQAYVVPDNIDAGIFTNPGTDYAWNDLIGWISFNCDNHSNCGNPDGINYKVATSWEATSTSGYVDSSTFDTNVTGGAQLNSVMWSGVTEPGTEVGFQFAGSDNPNEPSWEFKGPDGTVDTYYMAVQNSSVPLDLTLHNNQQYFRYRVTLFSDLTQRNTPRIDEISINWSP